MCRDSNILKYMEIINNFLKDKINRNMYDNLSFQEP